VLLSFLYCKPQKDLKVNVEQLIRQYLYENKSISLPGIGRLAFSGSSPLPSPAEKGENLPLPDLGFTYNLQEQAEPAFIAFVAEQTGKIKPLATSDIDSFFTLAKQFINIGKSFIIDGVGVVNKMDNGQYSFVPGTYLPVVETISHLRKPLKIREPIPVIKRDINLRDEPEPINKKVILVIAIIIVLGLIVWGVLHFLGNRTPETKQVVQTADTTAIVHETAAPQKDSVTAAPTTPPPVTTTAAPTTAGGPNDYKAIFETTTDKKRALDRLSKLRSYKIDVHLDATADSSNFKLWVPVNAAPADTLHKRDSLSKYFARAVKLEKL
jgi:hypothetical protein